MLWGICNIFISASLWAINWCHIYKTTCCSMFFALALLICVLLLTFKNISWSSFFIVIFVFIYHIHVLFCVKFWIGFLKFEIQIFILILFLLLGSVLLILCFFLFYSNFFKFLIFIWFILINIAILNITIKILIKLLNILAQSFNF